MRPVKHSILVAALAAPGLLPLGAGFSTVRGDEQGRLGRLFRFGAPASPAAPTSEGPPITTPSDPTPAVVPAPSAGSNPAQPRLIPQPRVSRAVTDADPIVTRISLGRSDDGAQFGMFLMVYADGTVIDSEGVHRVGRDAIKEVSGALARTDFFRIKGHCGGPSIDFVEQVQMVVYERSLGRLRANAFSFSGNTHGCDHAVQHLQTALDALQGKLSRPVPGSTSSPIPHAPGDTPTAAPIRLNDGSPH